MCYFKKAFNTSETFVCCRWNTSLISFLLDNRFFRGGCHMWWGFPLTVPSFFLFISSSSSISCYKTHEASVSHTLPSLMDNLNTLSSMRYCWYILWTFKFHPFYSSTSTSTSREFTDTAPKKKKKPKLWKNLSERKQSQHINATNIRLKYNILKLLYTFHMRFIYFWYSAGARQWLFSLPQLWFFPLPFFSKLSI